MPMRRLVCILLSALSLHSCVEPLDVDKQYVRKPVVNCLLCAEDSVQYVDIKYNGKMGTILFDRVPDAEVRIFADDVEIGKFEKVAFSRWQIDLRPEYGVRYRLEVMVEGEEEMLTAETVMPYPVSLEKNHRLDMNNTRGYVQHAGESPAYWLFIFQKNDGEAPDREVPDRFLNSYHKTVDLSTDHPDVDQFNRRDNASCHDTFLRIPAAVYPKDVPFRIEGYLDNSILAVRSMSDDYDLYLKSSYQKIDSYMGGDITDYFEENVIYSNWNNGVGIFGAYTESMILHNAYDR